MMENIKVFHNHSILRITYCYGGISLENHYNTCLFPLINNIHHSCIYPPDLYLFCEFNENEITLAATGF